MFTFKFFKPRHKKTRSDNWPQNLFTSVIEGREKGLVKDLFFRVSNAPSEKKVRASIGRKEISFDVEELLQDGSWGPKHRTSLFVSSVHFIRDTIVVDFPPLEKVQFDPETGEGAYMIVM